MNISPKAKETTDRLNNFMDKHVYPNNETYHSQIENFGADRWQVVPVIEDLKKEAKKEDLWNLFLPESDYGHGLTNAEYAPMCEIMGRAMWSAEVFNRSLLTKSYIQQAQTSRPCGPSSPRRPSRR